MAAARATGAFQLKSQPQINLKALTATLSYPSAFAMLRRDKMGDGEVVPATLSNAIAKTARLPP
jgi:hypothetical protein